MYLVALFASLLIFIAVFVSYFNSRYFSLFHPFTFYSAFHGVVFVFRPLLAYYLKYQAIYRWFQFTPTPEDKLTAIAVTTLGFLSFAFFTFRSGAVEMQFKQDRLLVDERNRLARIFPWVLAVCFPIGLWSLLTLYQQATNFEVAADMGRDLASGVYYNTNTTGYFVEAQLMLATLGAVVAWLFRFRLVAIAPIALFAVMRAGTGGRGPFVTALVSAGLLYFYERRIRYPNLRLVGLGLMLALVFSAIGYDRGQAVRAFFGAQTDSRLVSEYPLKFGEGMDLGNLEFVEYMVGIVPEKTHTYTYFNDVLQLFTEPIPRILWKGKPFGAPFEQFSPFDYGNPVGMTRSLPGEGWYGFGWLGVVAWCGLYGYILGLVYRRFAEGPQNTFHVAAYMMFLPIMIIGYRDGVIVTVFRQGIFFMAPILLWVAVARFFNVPLASAFRKALKRRQQGVANGTTPGALPGPAAPLIGVGRALPAAVRRRRQRLASGGQD